MKFMKKSLALFVALIMVLGIVPAYAASNGASVDISALFCDADENPIVTTGDPTDVVVNSGETVIMNVNFANNGTQLPSTICVYTLVFASNPAKVKVVEAYESNTVPTFNAAFNDEGVFVGTWTSTDGIKSKGSILSQGTLFQVVLTALQDLTEDDLAKIKPIAEASSVDSEGTPVTSKTSVQDYNKDDFTINWSANVQEEVLPEPITIDASKFTVDTGDKTWTGAQIKPAVTSSTIPEEVYTVSYGANTDLGTNAGTITISLNNPDTDGFVWVGKQRYTGEAITLNFNIVEKAIAEGDFTFDLTNKTYTGSEITPDVTSTTLTSADYGVAYSDNTNAGTATITVTGKGNYKGTVVKTFKIVQKSIEESDFTFDIDPAGYEFDGRAIEPGVTPTGTLVEDQDYTVTYSNNSMAGVTGKVTVKGQGNYTGTITKEFQIKAEQLAAEGEITLGYAFTSIEDGATSYDPEARISEVAAGEKFVIWVNVGNNGTASKEDTIAAYDLLLQYDNSQIELKTYGDGLTNPEVNLWFNDNTVMASWANNSGITQGMPAKLQKDATLFVIEAKALTDLDADALLNLIDYVNTATSTGGNDQATSFVRRNRSPYTIVDGAPAVVEITNSHVVIDTVQDYVYTGSEITPDITLNNIDESEFDIAYTDNVNKGQATATVTGKGKFYGSFDVNFNIIAKDIVGADFALAEKNVVYTGSAIEVDVISELVEDTDFEVEYTDNVEVGTATVIITGIGNYKGTVTKTFEIVNKELKDSYFTIETSKVYADGADIEVAITTDLDEDVDYTVTYSNNKNVGTATIVFTGIGGYEGTVTKTFEITARELTTADFTLNPDSYEYTGTAIIPTVETAVAGLAAGKDYTVVYTDNVNAGTATATFTGIGNYTGEVVKTFTITPQPIDATDFDLTAIVAAQYTGLPIEPIVNSATLVEGRDYAVKYTDNVNAGTATVTITGKGNYNFTLTENFEITAKPLTDGDFALAATEVVYTGSELKPDVITMLVNGTDFDVAYTDNTTVGTATATITGKKNYSGIITKTFKIVAKEITAADFTLDLDNQTYDGTEKTVDITTALLDGTDYEVTYINNTNAGTATVAIAGKGNYKGEIVKTFVIDPAAIQVTDFTFGDPEPWYEAKKDAGLLAAGIKPEVTSTLSAGDYEVIYTNNTVAGIATITVKGTGNYTGTVTDTFEIKTYRLGDVDNDATWSTIDAVRILKMATDLYTDPTDLEKIAANVVNDTKYNAIDALEVLKYSALIKGAISDFYGESANFSN